MGKKNQRRARSRTRSQQNRRRSNHHRKNASRSARSRARQCVCPVPWAVLRERNARPEHFAADGSATIPFQLLGEHDCFAVFNSEGLLGEFIELVGPPGLGDEDEQLLQMFMLRRHAVGDPLFAELPSQAGQPQPPLLNPRTGQRELRRFVYKHYPVAADGSRTVMAIDHCGDRWLFAINAEGIRFDAIWLDGALGGNPLLRSDYDRFIAARSAAGDPLFTAAPGGGS